MQGLRGSLAAGLKTTGNRDGHAEIFIRIHWSVIDADFVVKMRSGGTSTGAHVADGVAAMDLLSGCDRYREYPP